MYLTYTNFLIVAQLFLLTKAQQCTTPQSKFGTCIPVRSCKPMLDLLDKVNKPIPPEIKTLLKSYQCGYQGRSPKICCPSSPINIGKDDGGNNQQPPDVSKHQNVYLLPKKCGHLDTTNKIVYGNKTDLLEFPWMALLSYQTSSGPQFKCGGTIINNRYILTAAHCITNLKVKLIGVRVGEHDIRTQIDCETNDFGEEFCAPPYQDLSIEKIIHHPKYNERSHINDIGLLRVSPINLLLENSRPVCLPLAENRNYNFTKRNVIITGWGATETGRSSPELLKVTLPYIPLDECKEAYKKIIALNDHQICAGGKSRSDSCGGDSGGPLHSPGFLHDETRLIQQGIVSFGPRDCGNEPLPGVYTRVAFFMDWILDTIQP